MLLFRDGESVEAFMLWLTDVVAQLTMVGDLAPILVILEPTDLSGTIIRGTLKTPNSQLVTPISIKLQRPDGYD
jgi:hypothetical protein